MEFENFERKDYLQKLIECRDNGHVKVITGMRGGGKTYLIFQLFMEYLLQSGVPMSNIVTLTIDRTASILAQDPLNAYVTIMIQMRTKGRYYLLIDEVQQVDFDDKSFLDVSIFKNLDVYVVWGCSRPFVREEVPWLQSEVDVIQVYPLTFSDFFSARGGEFEDAWQQYMTVGGLPIIKVFEEEDFKEIYLNRDVPRKYLQGIAKKNNLTCPEDLKRLVKVLAMFLGKLTNPTKISRAFAETFGVKYANRTASVHLDYLIEEFLIYEVRRYDIRNHKYIGADRKYYFADIGLRNIWTGYESQDLRATMENIVYNELLARGYHVDIGIIGTYGKNEEGKRIHKQLKVDFVAEQANLRYYIQVEEDLSSPEKEEQAFEPFRKIRNHRPKIVIVREQEDLQYSDEGFLIMGIRYFLLNADSLEKQSSAWWGPYY